MTRASVNEAARTCEGIIVATRTELGHPAKTTRERCKSGDE